MLKIILSDIEYNQCEEIKNITTIKTKGCAKVFYPKNQKQLIFLYNLLSINNIKFALVGGGSNVLISDRYMGYIVSLSKMRKNILIRGNSVIVCAGVKLSDVYKNCQEHGLSGFEKLATIPASIGGAIRMNASFDGSQISDHLVWIKVLRNGKIEKILRKDLMFGYRKGYSKGLILSAKFTLRTKDRDEIRDEFMKNAIVRLSSQPQGNSFGSVFKNPRSVSAGRLIEECALKGKRQGGAIISNKHANFILNTDNASFGDVLYLIQLMKKEVYKKFKVRLEREVKIIK